MSDIVSNTSIVSPAIKNRWYDEIFLRRAEKELVHQQVGQLNRGLPKGEGKVVYWTRFKNLSANTTAGAEGVVTTSVGLSAENISATVAQYDGAVKISDLLAQTALGDIMQQATEILAYKAGLSIDQIVRNAVVPNVTIQGAGTSYTTATRWSSIPNTAVLSIGELRKATLSLMKRSANRPTSKTSVSGSTVAKTNENNKEGYWCAIVSPDQVYGLQGDSATGAWIDVNRYAGSEQIYAGEVGKLYGIRFLQTANIYYKAGAGVTGIVSSGDVEFATVFGSDCFGVTNLQNLEIIRHGFGSAGVYDPTNKLATIGYKTTFAAKVLNAYYGISIMSALNVGTGSAGAI